MGLTDVGGCEEDQQDAFSLYPFTTIAIFFFILKKRNWVCENIVLDF